MGHFRPRRLAVVAAVLAALVVSGCGSDEPAALIGPSVDSAPSS